MQNAIRCDSERESATDAGSGKTKLRVELLRLGVRFIAVIVLQELYSSTAREARRPPVKGGRLAGSPPIGHAEVLVGAWAGVSQPGS